MMMFCRLCSIIAYIACVALLSGCGPAVGRSAHGGIDYPYGPLHFQIHLLSRLECGSDARVSGAVVCVEFDDIDRQTTRATGLLEIAITLPDQPVLEKAFNLNDLKINTDIWNRTTRMYQIVFQFDPALAQSPEGGVPFEVTWTPVDGSPITVQGVLRALNRQ